MWDKRFYRFQKFYLYIQKDFYLYIQKEETPHKWAVNTFFSFTENFVHWKIRSEVNDQFTIYYQCKHVNYRVNRRDNSIFSLKIWRISVFTVASTNFTIVPIVPDPDSEEWKIGTTKMTIRSSTNEVLINNNVHLNLIVGYVIAQIRLFTHSRK